MNHRILLTLCLALSAAESVHSQPLIKIAFVSDRDGNDEIYSVHPDGSDLANLTGNPADDHSPAWSPDGQRIAFVSDRGGDNDIYTMTADGTDVTNLTGDAEDDQRPAWSPDGARIAFISTREGQIDLYVMGTDGSGAVNLTMGAPGRITDGPFWSPEGSRLAFVAERDVYLVDYDGDNLTNLTQDQGSTRGPSWSPDGQRLAYTAPRNAPFSSPVYAEGSTIPVRDLFRVDVDGEGLVNLSNSLSKESAPAWSPDGTSIVVTIDRYGYEGSMAFYDETDLCLYVYSAEGSTGRKLFCSDDTHHYRTVDFPAWSPDGTMVAVQVTRRTVDRRGGLDEDSGDIDIFVVPVDGSRPLNLTDHPARDHQLAWSPPLARTAGAGVFVVDTTGDMGDRDPGDGRCADEEDSCSLRTAIEEANSSAGIDTIFFAIPGPGPHTIVPMPALPAILEPVVIDGTSEPDFMGTPIIELNGSRAGSGNTGLRVRAGDSVIKGLVINRFDADGIVLEGPGNNLLQGNYIGTDISGTAGVGNGGDGVHVASGAHNTIGGRDGAGGNIIAFNGGNGASIAAGASNAILKNAIHSNGGIGIDLGRDGVTDNDDDVDANQGQNAPVLHAATTAHVISGTLDSGASSTFLIELFLNDACDPSGWGEGAKLIDAVEVVTADDGNAEFDLVHFTAVSTGQFVTATATDPEGNTSEFSACIVVTRPPEKPPQERGTIVTVAGTGAGKWIDGKRVSYSGDGGPAVNASMSVSGLFVDRHGQIFIADRESHRIRKVDADGIVTTVAGNGEAGSAGDGGPATQAQLESPSDVFVDHGGNLFITDGRANRVRKVDSNGIISTIAGTGDRGFSGDGGPAVQAALAGPGGVFPVASGHIYVADGGNARVRRIDPDGTIRTIAGTGSRGFSGDGGPALQAELTGMHALFVVRSGDVYFIDVSNSRVRKIDADGIITTVAGNGEHAESTRSAPDGQRITELPLAPGGLFVDGGGNMFITDRSRNRVYRIDADGVITTVAGNADRDVSGDGGPAVEAGLGFLLGKIFVDGAGDLYIAGSNRVRRVAGVAVPTTLDAATTTAVVETGSPVQPRSPRLEQNAPNPFNSQTVIRFSLARQTELELTVYNLAGQKVVTLLKQRRAAGDHVVVWNGRDDEGVELGTGVYLYRLRTESQVATRKLLLLH